MKYSIRIKLGSWYRWKQLWTRQEKMNKWEMKTKKCKVEAVWKGFWRGMGFFALSQNRFEGFLTVYVIYQNLRPPHSLNFSFFRFHFTFVTFLCSFFFFLAHNCFDIYQLLLVSPVLFWYYASLILSPFQPLLLTTLPCCLYTTTLLLY